jgi:hypothetical protein
MAIKLLMCWQHTYSMDKLDKELFHVPGRMEWNGMRVHHNVYNDMQFKTYELFLEITI